MVRTMRNNRYIVERVDDHEGPQKTSTALDYEVATSIGYGL